MITFEHEIALQELGKTYDELPLNLKGAINNWKRKKEQVYADPENPNGETALKAESIKIADQIQDWVETDLPEAQEEQTTNTENMLTDEQKARGKEAGLEVTDATTVADIEAAEAAKKAQQEEETARAQKEKAEKEAEEAEAARKKEQEEAAAAAGKTELTDEQKARAAASGIEVTDATTLADIEAAEAAKKAKDDEDAAAAAQKAADDEKNKPKAKAPDPETEFWADLGF